MYKSSCNWHSFASDGTKPKSKGYLRHCPTTDPYEIVAIDILGPLSKMTKLNQHVVTLQAQICTTAEKLYWEAY